MKHFPRCREKERMFLSLAEECSSAFLKNVPHYYENKNIKDSNKYILLKIVIRLIMILTTIMIMIMTIMMIMIIMTISIILTIIFKLT